MLFVGEKRSEKAVKMGVRWEDGKLAAKQLFDALKANGIDPSTCKFINWFEKGTKNKIKSYDGVVFGMGRKVQEALAKSGVEHIPIVHPAARGKIRKKERYTEHIKEVLEQACVKD